MVRLCTSFQPIARRDLRFATVAANPTRESTKISFLFASHGATLASFFNPKGRAIRRQHGQGNFMKWFFTLALAMLVLPAAIHADTSSSDCFKISDVDMRNACLGTTNSDSFYCFKIRSKNYQYACLAETKRDRSYCFRIVNDTDLQNACLGQVKPDSSYCFKMRNENERYACLAETEAERSYCFKITNDNDLQSACLAQVPR